MRINPEHSHDKNIAEKLFSKIFWQLWERVFSREQQQNLAADLNKLLQNLVKNMGAISTHVKTQFARTMLEQVVALKQP